MIRIVRQFFEDQAITGVVTRPGPVCFSVLACLDFKNVQSYLYPFNNNGQPNVEEIVLWPILPTLDLTVHF